ncbi:hypothetical protein [Phaeospirillum tilakii]|uniref:Tetratricopeptide repeat-containing protein n=1 Tax=Phaeospirillum tilakii TaxID=741673 RepID=A0ABW5CBK0_9PROT
MTEEIDLDRWFQAGADLPDGLRSAFRRLGKELAAHRGRWGLFILEFEHAASRDRVAAAIEQGGATPRRLRADPADHPDWPSLEQAIVAAAAGAGCVELFGLESWLDPLQATETAERLRGLNRRREAFARAVPVPVLFWLRPLQVRDLATLAPDVWSWRAGVDRFLEDSPVPPSAAIGGEASAPLPHWAEFDNRTAAERRVRLAELEAYLDGAGDDANPALIAALRLEQADLLAGLGEYEAALAILRDHAVPAFTALDDEYSRAATMGRIADILQARGELDAALKIRQEEQLPVYDRLDDVRERAVTMGRIADILQARGAFDAALKIRQEEELPVYDRLGDVRSRAVTMGKIADILQARGELDAALKIRQEEQLPVYDRLGDVRERAVTMGRIADILQARGELDAALKIRQEEELPVYDRLGDVRERAVTMGRIADILQARGELDAALKIRQEEELPVYDRLGDVRERAVTRGKIADILQARGEFDAALKIRQEEMLPAFDRLGDVRERAVTMSKIADILQARGELDASLKIRQEEMLPAFERLGAVRERAVTMGQIADILQARGELDAALKIRQEEELPVYQRLGYIDGLSNVRFNRARLLMKKNGLTEGNAEAIHDDLAESFALVQKTGVATGLVEVGSLFGQVLAARGETEAALAVFDRAATAAERLGWSERAAKLRAEQERLRHPPSD